ncbi:MAG: CBS domain-containing protein [Deltaproteobacteria bacterium]|jgi:acetoin utilization protein AcuB|nr:CBS domain-containing protein [Deltaproteobacteria bacterium]
MLIEDWMASKLLTIDENTSVMRAMRMMKENKVRRLPVLAHGKLVGMITDRDLKEASPAKTNSLDIHELNYLLAEMKVKEVMTPKLISMKHDETLEKAAIVMLQNKISGLPIMDENGNLVGLLSETDVVRGFIHATGIADGTLHYIMDLIDQSGTTASIIDICRQHGAKLISILTSYEDAPKGMKRVALRIACPDDQQDSLNEKMAEAGTIIHSVKDKLQDLPQKQD